MVKNVLAPNNDYKENTTDKVMRYADTAVVVSNALSVVGSNVGSAVNSIKSSFSEAASSIMEYKFKIKSIKMQLELIDKQNKNSLESLKFKFENINPQIKDLLDGATRLLESLNKFDLSNMTEDDHKTYRLLLESITRQRDQVLSMYDKIL